MDVVSILNNVSSVIGVPCCLLLFWYHNRMKALEDKTKVLEDRIKKQEDKSENIVNDFVEMKNDIRWIRTILEKKVEKE